MNGGRSAVGSPGRGPVGQVQSCVRRGPHAAIREERARAEASRRCRPGVAEAESEDACDREGGGGQGMGEDSDDCAGPQIDQPDIPPESRLLHRRQVAPWRPVVQGPEPAPREP